MPTVTPLPVTHFVTVEHVLRILGRLPAHPSTARRVAPGARGKVVEHGLGPTQVGRVLRKVVRLEPREAPPLLVVEVPAERPIDPDVASTDGAVGPEVWRV